MWDSDFIGCEAKEGETRTKFLQAFKCIICHAEALKVSHSLLDTNNTLS